MSAPQYYQTNYNFTGTTTSNPPSISDIGVSLVPVGSLLLYGGTALPENYLWCNGASLSTTTYNILFSVLGYTYGGSDASFNLPNLSEKFPIGSLSNSEMTVSYQNNQITTGGNKNMNLNQLASHTHNSPNTAFFTGANSSSGAIKVATADSSTLYMYPETSTASAPTGGGGQDFLPPFTVVNYIIKYK